MKIKFPLHAPLDDAADLRGAGGDVDVNDRGDEGIKAEAEPTAEEKKLAEDLKSKGDADTKAKEEADAKAKADAEAAKGKGKDDDDDDDPDKRKDTRIPLSRHKAIVEAERAGRAAAEAKLAQFERGKDIQETNEEIAKAEDNLLKMEADYNKLLADGKHDEATKIMTQIRKTERSINDTKAEFRSQMAEARAYERARYDITVDRIEDAYPEMKPGTDEHNPTLIAKVMKFSRVYQKEDNMTPAEAIQQAVKDVLGEAKNKKQEAAVDTKPRVDEAAAKKAAREEEARKKAADAASKTPPNEKVGEASDKLGGSLKNIDVMKLSQTDFAKLDEAALAQLRGDDGAHE